MQGPVGADLTKVELLNLNLAHANGVSERINVATSEEFVWKIVDALDRTLAASTELAGMEMKLEWNDAEQSYEVVLVDPESDEATRPSSFYTPPRTDCLFDIRRARVSPFIIILSFKRQPHLSRFKGLKGGSGPTKLVNYAISNLKFTLDKAELSFARYDATDIRGPMGRLLDLLSAVYTSRMKKKVFSILRAASFQDWKRLASRGDGDDEFVEGDILRATGSVAGGTAGLIAKKVGNRLGDGLSSVSHSIGGGIESASERVGARRVGAGINSVVSGIGEGVGDTVKGGMFDLLKEASAAVAFNLVNGVGDTVKGVGSGAGHVLKGAGKGVGRIVGGATGAVLMAGKGIKKGVTTGDGRAVADGFADAAVSVGTGVGQGLESAAKGAAGGVLAVGKGLFSGVKNVGRGVGGAVGGKQAKRAQHRSYKNS
eukprot:CAMPEP_0116849460 /NCGR_PEP_ID=MMETSP0418-20121206/15589_1 /TAXON_ID=1158023 /ORGANISM="Astrosyne radiata, Strain 13vi08-1A" /LENGTH=428 /DNA_ID=CAMNT_0004481193 /DNA_START=133 /DNA_END=1418 /DNA_ORIENTATION=+